MKIAIIVAMARNRIIGINNNLPWHLPEDMKYFVKVTMGKPIIMGRKTFESIGKPLPGRTNIIITRNNNYQIEGAKVVTNIQAAIRLLENITLIDGKEEAMIIGGAEIYKLALPITDRLYLTLVHSEVKGDIYFPEFDMQQWQEVWREDFKAQEPNPYDYSFTVLDRL